MKVLSDFLELDPFRKEVHTAFDNLNDVIEDYEKIDPEGYIFDNVGEIINKVDLHREELIKEINEKSMKYDEIIKRLKDKEQACKLNATKSEKMNLDELKNDILPSLKQSLRIPDLKQEEFKCVIIKNV